MPYSPGLLCLVVTDWLYRAACGAIGIARGVVLANRLIRGRRLTRGGTLVETNVSRE